METLKHAFSSDGFMPHGFCFLWNPKLLWLHALSNGLIFAAYLSIPFTLVYFARQRQGLPFRWLLWCCAAFIISCGFGHGMDVWTLWHPDYWLSGAIKAVTAVASVSTAVLLVKLVPQVLALPSPEGATPGGTVVRPGLAAVGGQPLWLAYGLAVVTTTATLMVIQAAGSEAATNAPVVVLVFPILLSAYVGGLVPGLLSTALATLALIYFILPPAHSWRVANPADNVKWIALSGAGALISILMADRERSRSEQASPQARGLLLSTERKVRAGFAVLLACLVAIAAVSYPTLVRLHEDTAWVNHTHQVIATLRLLLSGATDAESCERGYIITGQEDYLKSYQSALRNANYALGELRRLTADNPTQQRRLDVLEPLFAERLAVLKEGIEMRRQGFRLAQALVMGGRGKQLHDRARGIVAEMETTEQTLLVEREVLAKHASTAAKVVIVGGSALAVVMVAAALMVIGQAFTASRRAETALQESWDQLDTRVRERTSALARANELLHLNEQRLAGIIGSAMDAVITVDERQRITLFNPAAEKMFGCAAIEALGHALERFIPQRFQAAHAEHIRMFGQSKITHKPMSQYREISGLRADGKEFPIEASISQTQVGEEKAFTVILRDITERKRTQEALRESEERFRGLVTASSDVVYRMSPDWSEMRQLRGRDFIADTDAPRRTWLQEYIHPDDQSRVMAVINEAIRTNSVFELEHRVLRVDGSLGWTFSRAVPLKDANGEIVEWFGAATDITERKRAEEALALKAKELARSNADLEQFAYVASHDLKEPLRAVGGCVRILQRRYEGKLDDRADEFIAQAVDGAARMESLIDDLLAFSRVGTRGGKFEALECGSVLDTALQNLAAAIQESGAVVTQDPLPRVGADASQLVSLFQNLIGNALKFHGAAPPRIHVDAQRNGAYWRFSVRDNGIGIDSQYVGRIFGIFQRLHTRSEYPGTGIGLAICKKIVERHGGRIWVESVPGEGTTFHFSLPDAQTHDRQPEGKTHA